jgi:crotonobetainyl-CoA:carnitine CoA-transferase CaiB-like acyl-CoA transferase
LQLAAVRDEHWEPLCRVLGREQLLDDPRFAAAGDRTKHRFELTDLLAEAFMADLATNWRRALRGAGVPAEISVDTFDGESILFDEELVRLGLVAQYEHPLLGRVRQFGNLITFSDTPGRQERATPMVGEHTRAIMHELGYDDPAVDDYFARGIVTWPGDDYAFGV